MIRLMPSLADSWTKHARALEHLASLVGVCDTFLDTAVFSAEVKPGPEPGTVEPEFYAEPPPPARLGAIVGDVAHNLRSALDVAAWHLALVNDAAAARRRPNAVSFPITDDPDGFHGHRALPFFNETARRAAEGLQPYHHSNEALGWLRDTSNSDKHRIATYSFTGLTPSPIREVGIRGYSHPQILFGTDEGRIGITGLAAIASAVESALVELDEIADSAGSE
jgi:hypothetical protein